MSRPLLLSLVLPAAAGLLVVLWENRPAGPLGRRRVRVLFTCLFLGLLLLEGIGLALDAGLWRVEETVVGPFAPYEAHAKMLVFPVGRGRPLPSLLEVRGDVMGDPSRSRLELSIDGVRRTHPHTAHDALRKGVTDGYSHWGDGVCLALAAGVRNDASVSAHVSYPIVVQPAVSRHLHGLTVGGGLLLLLLLAGGELLFVFAQLVLMEVNGLGRVAALALVSVLLLGCAVGVRDRLRRGDRWARLIPACAGGYLAYWLTQKYVLPLGGSALAAHLAHAGGGVGADLFAMVGVSYIGFKLMHFLVDWRRGALEDVEALDVLAWLLFFPSIVAGPMQKFQDWRAQRAARKVTGTDLAEGVKAVLVGMVLKFVLADSIHGATLPQLSSGTLSRAHPSALALAATVYSLYLYWDFAGYSLMAIGLARFWGVRLPENFRHPFLARNLAEFWNRWHISLGVLLRDYLFYPLSLTLKRMPRLRPYPSITAALPALATFSFVGIWHGAGVGFAIYGLLHGIGLATLAVASRRRPHTLFGRWWAKSRVGHATGMGLNFAYVTLSFVFFGLDREKLGIIFHRLVP